MPGQGQEAAPKDNAQAHSASGESVCAQGLWPAVHWVPDLRASARHWRTFDAQVTYLRDIPLAAIDAWINAVYDWSEWR